MSFYPSQEELPPLGALCLDYSDDIHRPPGDPLNEESFQCPLIHQQVKNGTVRNIVFNGVFSDEFVDNFVEACNILETKGCVGVITSCGFLAQIQSRLAARVTIPVATSSLLQIPSVFATLPPTKKIAILTFDKDNLGKLHFNGVGIPSVYQERIVVYGAEAGGHLKDLIMKGGQYIIEELQKEMVALAKKALDENKGEIGAFVLECTQMPPTSKAIQDATGLRVYDVITMIDWFYSGLKARTFKEDKFKKEGLRFRSRPAREVGE